MQSFLYQIYVIMAVFHFEIDPKNVERFRIHFFNWQVCIWIRCDFFWIKIQLQILVYLIFDSRRRSIMSMKCTYASHCMHTWVIMVRKRADNLFIFFLFLVNHNNLSLVFYVICIFAECMKFCKSLGFQWVLFHCPKWEKPPPFMWSTWMALSIQETFTWDILMNFFFQEEVVAGNIEKIPRILNSANANPFELCGNI